MTDPVCKCIACRGLGASRYRLFVRKAGPTRPTSKKLEILHFTDRSPMSEEQAAQFDDHTYSVLYDASKKRWTVPTVGHSKPIYHEHYAHKLHPDLFDREDIIKGWWSPKDNAIKIYPAAEVSTIRTAKAMEEAQANAMLVGSKMTKVTPF